MQKSVQYLFKKKLRMDMIVHVYKPSTQENET